MSALTSGLKKLVAVEEDEVRPALWSAAYFFFIMAGYFILRPIRDAAGAAGGIRNLPWLFTGTMIAMLIVNPPFAAAVAKFGRQRFITIAYRFFIVNLLLFVAAYALTPEGSQVWLGRTFYIWTSVFNLFVVSVFWGFMADRFNSSQGKRLFGFIGVGGTLGTIVGSLITATQAKQVGVAALLVVSAVMLEAAVFCVRRLSADTSAQDRARAETPMGGGVLSGITHVVKSPYLLGICGYMLLYTIGSTFLYFQQVSVVSAAEQAGDARMALFAKIDLMVNVLTIVVQSLLTGRLLAAVGLAATLAIVPAISIVGFLGLGFLPSLAMLIAVLVLRRAGNYAVARPSRELLYTVVKREDKFKAKSFIDTFVYRLGDQVGAWANPLLTAAGLSMAGIALVAAPLSLLWLIVGWWLGRRHAAMASAAPAPTGSGEPVRAA